MVALPLLINSLRFLSSFNMVKATPRSETWHAEQSSTPTSLSWPLRKWALRIYFLLLLCHHMWISYFLLLCPTCFWTLNLDCKHRTFFQKGHLALRGLPDISNGFLPKIFYMCPFSTCMIFAGLCSSPTSHTCLSRAWCFTRPHSLRIEITAPVLDLISSTQTCNQPLISTF